MRRIEIFRFSRIFFVAIALLFSNRASAFCESETRGLENAQAQLSGIRAEIESKRQTLNRVQFHYYSMAVAHSRRVPRAERTVAEAQSRVNACVAAAARPVATPPAIAEIPASRIPEACFAEKNKLDEYRSGAAAIETRLSTTRTPMLISQYQFDLQIRQQMVANQSVALNRCVATNAPASTAPVARQTIQPVRVPASVDDRPANSSNRSRQVVR